jgi:hypothetical protein
LAIMDSGLIFNIVTTLSEPFQLFQEPVVL